MRRRRLYGTPHSAASRTWREDCDLSTGASSLAKSLKPSSASSRRAAEAEGDVELEIADNVPTLFEPAQDLVGRSPACGPHEAGDGTFKAALTGDLRLLLIRVVPSRPGEFHPEPLTDPDLNLSIHPARVTARRLPPSAEPSGSSRFDPVGPCSTAMTCPLCSTGITPLHHYCGAVRPSPAHRYFRPHGWSRLCLSLSIAGQVLTFHTRARLSFAPPTCRMPLGQSQCIPQADPGRRVNPRFWHRLIRFRHFIDGSLALASLNRACRDHVPTFPQRSPPSLLTTAACGGLRSTPDCRPRRALLHLSYSCAWPFGPAMLVTQDPSRS